MHLDVRWLRRLQVHTQPLQAQLLPAQQVFGGQGGRRMRPLDGVGRLRIPQQALDVHIRHPPLALELQLRPLGTLGELHRAIKTGQGTHQAYIQMRSHVRLERLQGQGVDLDPALGHQRVQLHIAVVGQGSRLAPAAAPRALGHAGRQLGLGRALDAVQVLHAQLHVRQADRQRHVAQRGIRQLHLPGSQLHVLHQHLPGLAGRGCDRLAPLGRRPGHGLQPLLIHPAALGIALHPGPWRLQPDVLHQDLLPGRIQSQIAQL